MITNVKQQPVSISAHLKESGVIHPNSGSGYRHNLYRVTLKTARARVIFDYYDSSRAYQDGKTELSPADLLFSFECFLSDAQAGADSFQEFMMLRDYHRHQAARIYKECAKSAAKAARILGEGWREAAAEYIELMNL